MSSNNAVCIRPGCDQPRSGTSLYCSLDCLEIMEPGETPEPVWAPLKCLRSGCQHPAHVSLGNNGLYCSIDCMWSVQQVQVAVRASSPAPQVVFFHKADPILWSNIVNAVESLSVKCEAGAISCAEELVQHIRQVRALTAVKINNINGQSDDLEDFKWAASTVQDESRHYGHNFYMGTKICEASQLTGRVFLFISKLVLKLPEFFPNGLLMSLQGTNSQTLLTRQQCAALLAASLFGAIPGHSVQSEQVEPSLDLPCFDLSYLLNCDARKSVCLLSYFVQLSTATEAFMQEVVSFTRRVEEPLSRNYWEQLGNMLSPVVVCEESAIENSQGNIQADFANEYLGGGALHGSSVQEEIRFSTCPECYVGMLFCERMDFNEVIFIVGTQQYCKYAGYGRTFHFTESHGQEILSGPLDEQGRRGPHIAAFDALISRNPGSQYGVQPILRELMKAYVACLGDTLESASQSQLGFATGNWGCGAFGGDPHLKFLIQWLAASAVGRKMTYFPFGDHRVQQIPAVIKAIQDSGACCSDLYNLLEGHTIEGQVFPTILQHLQKDSGRQNHVELEQKD